MSYAALHDILQMTKVDPEALLNVIWYGLVDIVGWCNPLYLDPPSLSLISHLFIRRRTFEVVPKRISGSMNTGNCKSIFLMDSYNIGTSFGKVSQM